MTRARTGQWERKLDKKTSQSAQKKVEVDAGLARRRSRRRGHQLQAGVRRRRAHDGGEGSNLEHGIMPKSRCSSASPSELIRCPIRPRRTTSSTLISLAPAVRSWCSARRFPGGDAAQHRRAALQHQLVPIRAGDRRALCSSRPRSVNKDTQKVFDQLLETREEMSRLAAGSATSVDSAIQKAISPREMLEGAEPMSQDPSITSPGSGDLRARALRG